MIRGLKNVKVLTSSWRAGPALVRCEALRWYSFWGLFRDVWDENGTLTFWLRKDFKRVKKESKVLSCYGRSEDQRISKKSIFSHLWFNYFVRHIGMLPNLKWHANLLNSGHENDSLKHLFYNILKYYSVISIQLS